MRRNHRISYAWLSSRIGHKMVTQTLFYALALKPYRQYRVIAAAVDTLSVCTTGLIGISTRIVAASISACEHPDFSPPKAMARRWGSIEIWCTDICACGIVTTRGRSFSLHQLI